MVSLGTGAGAPVNVDITGTGTYFSGAGAGTITVTGTGTGTVLVLAQSQPVTGTGTVLVLAQSQPFTGTGTVLVLVRVPDSVDSFSDEQTQSAFQLHCKSHRGRITGTVQSATATVQVIVKQEIQPATLGVAVKAIDGVSYNLNHSETYRCIKPPHKSQWKLQMPRSKSRVSLWEAPPTAQQDAPMQYNIQHTWLRCRRWVGVGDWEGVVEWHPFVRRPRGGPRGRPRGRGRPRVFVRGRHIRLRDCPDWNVFRRRRRVLRGRSRVLRGRRRVLGRRCGPFRGVRRVLGGRSVLRGRRVFGGRRRVL